MRFRAYDILDRAVEEGVAYGYMRAYKHGTPNEHTLKEAVHSAVMSAICEVLDFDDPEPALRPNEVWVRAAEPLSAGQAVVAWPPPPVYLPDPEVPVSGTLTYERLLEVFLQATGGEAYGANLALETDCVRAALEVLELLYGKFTPTGKKDVLISHGDRGHPYSGLDAVRFEAGGMPVSAPSTGRVHFMQGWRVLDPDGSIPLKSPSPNGHAGFLYAPVTGPLKFVSANVRGAPWVKEYATWQDVLDVYKAGAKLVVLP